VWGDVVFPNLAKKEAGSSYCCDGGVHCDKVRKLHDTINNVHDSVVAIETG
jgi:hypothetical protein